jgi:hypothetical protein
MEADVTHTAISISPTTVEIPNRRTVLNSIFTKAVLVLGELVPPPPTPQIASLSLHSDTKKSRSAPIQGPELKETATPSTVNLTRNMTPGNTSVTSTPCVSSITSSQVDGLEQDEEIPQDQTTHDSELAHLIEALHPTIYDICTHLLIVSGIPTDMSAEILLQNISDILTYYYVPYDTQALRTQLDFEWDSSSLRNIRYSPGNQHTGSLVVRLSRECSFGNIYDAKHDRFPRFISEPTYLFSSMRNGRDVAYSTILYFNPISETDVEAITHPNSRLLTVRGGVGYVWTDICLLTHLHNLQNEISLGPIEIHAECSRRGQRITAKRSNNLAQSPSLPRQREWKHGYDVFYTIYSTGPQSTWNAIRETIRMQIITRCHNKDDSNWTTEAGPGITLLGSCPVLWKAGPLMYFELYSPIYDFESVSFLTIYCYPHHLRGDDRVVTLLTITGVHPLHGSTTPINTIAPPTVPELLHLLAAAFINLDHLAFVINMPPIHSFTTSTCPYGNTDPSSANHKHRYAIIWKDGIERMLPVTLHTALATFTFSAALEPGHNLPGFWTTECSRSKFYNGMLRALYTAYSTSKHGKKTGDQHIPGMKPSIRWYQYRQNVSLHQQLNPAQPITV